MKKSKSKLILIKNSISRAEENLKNARLLIEDLVNFPKTNFSSDIPKLDPKSSSKIILGAFDGENMISNEGKKYPVPSNYASKSKLVSGDKLKLTILEDGSFLYKQIGPVKRKRITGKLKIHKNKFSVETKTGDSYLVLPASITYFKAGKGDNLTIIVPEKEKTKWAAVETILPNIK